MSKLWLPVVIVTTAVIGVGVLFYTMRSSTTTTATTTKENVKKIKRTSPKRNDKSKSKKKKKNKKKGFKSGFLNGLNGLDSPSKSKSTRKSKSATSPLLSLSSASSSSSSSATATKQSAEELEAEAIADFIRTSKSMQNVAQSTGNADKKSALQLLQRRRQAIVAGLQNINGQASIAKLEVALTTMDPPPPPPEPTELYRQSIAHRIMVDPKFKMKKKESTGLEKEVQATVRAAYWDSIRYKLSQNDGVITSEVISSLIREVCTAIVDIRGEESPPFRTQMAKLLSDSIDLEFLQQQCSEQRLTLTTLSNIVAAIMTVLHKCQSPERDAASTIFLQQVQERLSEPEDVEASLTKEEQRQTSMTALVGAIEFIFDGLFTIVEDIKRDLLNHQLSMMRTHLSHNGEGVKYQRELFQQRIEKGEIDMSRTTDFVQQMLSLTNKKEAEGIRHAHVLCLVDLLFHICTATKTKETLLLKPPETFDVETEDMDDISRKVLDLISALSLVLKTNQYVASGLKLTSLTMKEKEELYTFYWELCSEKVQEKVQEIEIPVAKKVQQDEQEQKTKKMLVVSRHDPHGKKGRTGRLERSAVYACDVVSKRTDDATSKVMTTDKKLKVQEYFAQMADDPLSHPVFNATTTITKNALKRCIGLFVKDAQRNAPALNAVDVSASMFRDGPLKPPPTSCEHFNEILKAILTMSGRNFEIYQGWYGDLYNNNDKSSTCTCTDGN